MGEADRAAGIHLPVVRDLYRAALEASPEAVMKGSPDRRRTDIEGEDERSIGAIRADRSRLDHHHLVPLISPQRHLVKPVGPM